LGWEHINLTGDYVWHANKRVAKGRFRPLRKAQDSLSHLFTAQQFKVTVKNLTAASQYVTLSYHVPNFTVDAGYPAGDFFSYNVGYVAAGASQSVNFAFTVLSGSQAPKGSLITPVFLDQARGASVSRTVTVK